MSYNPNHKKYKSNTKQITSSSLKPSTTHFLALHPFRHPYIVHRPLFHPFGRRPLQPPRRLSIKATLASLSGQGYLKMLKLLLYFNNVPCTCNTVTHFAIVTHSNVPNAYFVYRSYLCE